MSWAERTTGSQGKGLRFGRPLHAVTATVKIGIIGGGITGLVIGIFLARAGHNVSIFEKKSLLSETSSKTTKLLHGGLRYLENFHFQEVKNGLNDRFWWLENFPKHTNKIKISSIVFLNSIGFLANALKDTKSFQ